MIFLLLCTRSNRGSYLDAVFVKDNVVNGVTIQGLPLGKNHLCGEYGMNVEITQSVFSL